MRQYPTPQSIIILTGFGMLICIPMLALSVVNFGILSIWLNAAVAFLILLHHISFSCVNWVANKRSSNRSTTFVIDPEEALVEEKSQWDDEPDVEMPIPFQTLNISCLVFLFILTAMAFGIMVDITSRGAMKSTLPAERIGSAKWNIKVQIGQTAVLGCELLVLGANLAICALGRRRVIEVNEDKDGREFMWSDNW
ncbi:hypothetical protein CVT25_009699 [Psilocybe cyanescens]|uniref:Uncharacterized protein n=1 Tax=Psilocybe cyanescens TaxID=93625 RepID=A0A409WWJ4_PSICY|nr:hypothetical protein CVT25_009699 [Psilocybe cyanescens]